MLCRPILGEEPFLPPSIWIWYLNQNQEDAGFPPHRDRSDLRSAPGELPKSMTVWAPLTDATPLNGCMYIVPAYLDEGYLKDNDTITPELHNVRALPAPAGSALLWNQRMLHWGGKSSQRATTPRISVAVEMQRRDVPSTSKPLLRTNWRPSLFMRLKIIGRSALWYGARYAYPPVAIDLFKQLSDLPAPDAPLDWDEQ